MAYRYDFFSIVCSHAGYWGHLGGGEAIVVNFWILVTKTSMCSHPYLINKVHKFAVTGLQTILLEFKNVNNQRVPKEMYQNVPKKLHNPWTTFTSYMFLLPCTV
jgi:hypothetical protein